MTLPKLAFNTKEAASVVGLSVDVIKRAIRAGRLRAKRSARTKDGDPAGNYVILAADLEAWLSDLEDA